MPAPTSPISVLRRLPGGRGVRVALVTLAGVAVGTGLLAVAQAIILAWLITQVATGGELGGAALALAAVLAARGLLGALNEPVGQWAGHRVSAALRLTTLRRWLGLPIEDRPDDGRALTLAVDGTTAAEPYIARFVPALVAAGVVPVLTLVVLAWVDIWSALIVGLTLPLLPFFAALIGRHTQAETDRRWSALSMLSAHFLDVVKGLPTLVGYGRATAQVEVVGQVGERHRRSTVQTLRTAFMSTTALELLATISVALVAVAVGLRLAEGWVPLQVGLTAILLAPEAYWPIRRVGAEFHNAVDGQQALADLLPPIPTEHVGGPGPDPTERAGGPVGLTAVRYAHGHRTVLDGLTLSTPDRPGLTVLTGPSGAGKTTVLDLLAGLRRPQQGVIRRPDSVHYATQRPLLTAGSVADNLRLAAPEINDDHLWAALRAVGLDAAMIEREGLDTELGDDGFGLSAGQRARLALARALLSPAELILLDEPTAHIAARSRGPMHEALSELSRDRRVIVASHDPDLAALADDRWEVRPNPAQPAPPDSTTAPAAPLTVTAGRSTSAQTPITTPATDQLEIAPPRQRRLLLACLLGGLALSCGVALTATSGWLIVRAWQQPVILTLLVAIVGVRAFGIGRPLFRYAERVVSHDLALAELTRRRVEVFTRLIPLTPARLGRRRRGDLLTAVVRDIDDAVFATVRVTVPAVSTVIATLVAAGIVAIVLPSAALVLLAAGLLIAAIGWLTALGEAAGQRADVGARAAVRGLVTPVVTRLDAYRAVLGPHRTGLTSTRVDSLLAPLQHRTHLQRRWAVRAASWRGVGIGLTWAVLAGTQLIVATIAATAYTSGATGAPLAALVALTPMAMADIWLAVPEIFGQARRARAASDRLETVLAQTPAVRQSPNARALPDTAAATPTVTLEQVSARWAPHASPDAADPGDAPDLRNLDLPAGAGARVLLTGPNGSGKSTAFAVIARYLDRSSGRYDLADADVETLTLAAVRDRIAIADDDPHIFTGSLRANLALASPTADDATLIDALTQAGLGAWYAGLEGGLDTPLGTGAGALAGAAGLSGGERTRVALARTLVSARPLLLLDEPTAHLDRPTATAVVADLLAVAGERTVIMVSHDRFGVTSRQWDEVCLTDLGHRQPRGRVLDDEPADGHPVRESPADLGTDLRA